MAITGRNNKTRSDNKKMIKAGMCPSIILAKCQAKKFGISSEKKKASTAHTNTMIPKIARPMAKSRPNALIQIARKRIAAFRTLTKPLVLLTGSSPFSTFCTTSSVKLLIFTGRPCILSCCSGVSASGIITARMI